MSQQNNQDLLHIHQYYTQEARQQQIMMWETVKWFTPILTLIGGGWIKYYFDEYLTRQNSSFWLILCALSIFEASRQAASWS